MTRRQRGLLLPPASLALVAGVFLGRNTFPLLWPVLAVLAGILSVLFLRGRMRFIACLLLSFSVGTAAGCYAFHPALPEEGDYSVQGVICDEASFGDFGQVRLYLSDVSLNDRPFSGKAYWTFYTDEPADDLLPGKAVSFIASLYHPRGAENPDGYDFRETLLQRGVLIGLYGRDDLSVTDPDFFSFFGRIASIRHSLSAAMIRNLGEETGSYASALLFGMRSLIPSEDRQAFSRLGIAHILSVSGFHVGILIAALAGLFRLLHLKPGTRIALYAVVLFLYAALCSLSMPVIRASILLLLSLWGRKLNRPRSGLHLLSAALVIMTLLSPVQVTSASFLLSFGAMFGLIWFEPVARRLNSFGKSIPEGICRSFILTFGVQMGILLPELYFFQRLPLLVFLINLPATLVFSLLISVCWILLILLPVPGLTGLLAGPVSAVTNLLLSGIRALGELPGLTLWIHSPTWLTFAGVTLFFTGCCAFAAIPAKTRAAILSAGTVILVLSLLPPAHPSTEYIQLSAGNADAAVLWDRDRVIVMDTGEADGTLSSFLRARRLTPDAVILTHLHSDHAGGLRSLMDDDIPIRQILLPAGAEDQQIHPDFRKMLDQLRASGTEIRTLTRGDVLPLPSGTLTVLWPEKGKIRPGQDANRYSLVSLLSLKGTVLLQAGDLTGAYESYCAVPANLLKASHHGSSSSTGEDFLHAVSPEAILLSCGKQDRLETFQNHCGNIPVYGTPECGAITVRFEEDAFSVIPYLDTRSAEGT